MILHVCVTQDYKIDKTNKKPRVAGYILQS